MKYWMIPTAAAALLFSMTACQDRQQEGTDQPGEQQGIGEQVEDTANEAGEAVQDKANEAGEAVQDTTEEAGEQTQDQFSN